jgi:hypothetical protein
MGKLKIEPVKVVIPCRLSYANIWEPKAPKEGQDKKYSVSAIIPKSDTKTLEMINKGIEKIKEEVKSKNGGKLPKNFHIPLRDGDQDREDEAYANSFFIGCNSSNKPKIFDRSLNEVIERDEVYSGCYANVSLNLFFFDVDTNRGIGAGLNGIQKIKDGEALGGGGNVKEDFAEVSDEDDDLL